MKTFAIWVQNLCKQFFGLSCYPNLYLHREHIKCVREPWWLKLQSYSIIHVKVMDSNTGISEFFTLVHPQCFDWDIKMDRGVHMSMDLRTWKNTLDFSKTLGDCTRSRASIYHRHHFIAVNWLWLFKRR